MDIEEALTRRALALGIQIHRGWKPSAITASGGREGLRSAKAKLDVTGPLRVIHHEEKGNAWNIWTETKTVPMPSQLADLVVVATGAGSSADPFVTQQLGIGYQHLGAVDFGFYGLYSPGPWFSARLREYTRRLPGPALLPVPKKETPTHRQEIQTILQTGFTLTSFHTPQHDYILGFLSGLTHDEFEEMLIKRDDPPEVKERKRKNARRMGQHVGLRETEGGLTTFTQLLADEKAVEVFEVKLAQATNLVSPVLPAVVIGDAAASPHPQTGSGLNTGVASLAPLGALVRELVERKPKSAAFARYEQAVGSISMVLILKALFAMATSFEFRARRVVTPQFAQLFQQNRGVPWDSWFRQKILAVKTICDAARTKEEAGTPDRSQVHLAWEYLDQVDDALRTYLEPSAQLEAKLTALDTKL
jgi:2-polyprenyl-6-methoxyphenol hydroxylase-like FAD-dependent oxidoreductase